MTEEQLEVCFIGCDCHNIILSATENHETMKRHASKAGEERRRRRRQSDPLSVTTDGRDGVDIPHLLKHGLMDSEM